MQYKVWDMVLEARVAAVNMANAYSNELWEKLHNAFEPLVGTKILKADGSFTAKVKEMVDRLEIHSDNVVHVYRGHSEYSLYFTVRSCQGSKSGRVGDDYNHSNSHETSVYIGNLNGQILKDVGYDCPNNLTNHTVENVKSLRERHAIAKKAASDAESALFPFGEYDR